MALDRLLAPGRCVVLEVKEFAVMRRRSAQKLEIVAAGHMSSMVNGLGVRSAPLRSTPRRDSGVNKSCDR